MLEELWQYPRCMYRIPSPHEEKLKLIKLFCISWILHVTFKEICVSYMHVSCL